PFGKKSAIRRSKRRNVYALTCQDSLPGAVGTEARPTGSAQGQHNGIGLRLDRPLRRVESKRRPALCPTSPYMTSMELNALRFETCKPSAQHGRRFHFARKHPSGRADEGL